MQVSLAKEEGLKRKLTVTVSADKVESEYHQKLQEVAKQAKLDGFRPGKVPVNVLEKRFGPSVRHEVIEKILRNSLGEAMQQEDISPAGMPTIDSLKAEPGKDLVYEASFEVYPEITVTDLKDVEIETVSSEVSADDIDKMLEKLRKQQADWEEIEREAKLEDQVTIDFDGYIDGEAIENGQGENMPLVLGSGTMIPGFEDEIVGAKPGEEREINATFPEGYHQKALAGKAAKFKIKVHKVMQSKLATPEELAKKLGVKDGKIETLKEDLRKHMDKESKAMTRMRNKEAVFEKLLERNEVELPESLVHEETRRMYINALQQQGQQVDEHVEVPEEVAKSMRESAVKRVKLGLLINEIVKKRQLAADEIKVRALVDDMAGSYENPEEFARWYYSDKNRIAQLQVVVLEDQVIEELLKDAKVTTKKLDYDSLINQNAN